MSRSNAKNKLLEVRMRSLVTSILLLTAVNAHAAPPQSGADFLPICEALSKKIEGNGLDLFNQGQCAGIIASLRIMGPHLEPALRFCTASTVTNGQINLVILKYVDANPYRRSEPFILLATEALRGAYPCKK